MVRVHVADRVRIGTPETNRTSDLPLRRGLLYPLSYRGAERTILPDRIRESVRIARAGAQSPACTASHRGHASK